MSGDIHKNMDEYNRCLKMIDTTYLNMAEKKL